MPIVVANGTRINYAERGAGEPVVLVMGTGSPGSVWQLHQVPALVAAGYRVLTFDNRGISPSPPGAAKPTVEDIVGDVVTLVERICGGRARLIGTSMGAHVVQEVMVARPDVVQQAVLMATRGRTDTFRGVLASAEATIALGEAKLPPRTYAVWRLIQSLSPHTLNDEEQARSWLDLMEFFPPSIEVAEAQTELERMADRLDAYRRLTPPPDGCLVIGFADDLVTPPHLGREVAESIPGARFEEVPRCGHFGYLERPEAVNALLVEFLRSSVR
ncbi:alpha/beta fold hydrolase [Verrucosispora sp. WMMD573]|uniref:alpha/beta fold hydrolase n=1 Tax=Verrucosispora sp. WMMD573 TaxID=3015149 RepID=UPI00248CE154|nr:alpha/beta fold hydrolase [Verrucosispora sp. WMMD573]WBB56649.1 alpha/beta fold hydrolase [Verrucosispora sp. WMMD573]